MNNNCDNLIGYLIGSQIAFGIDWYRWYLWYHRKALSAYRLRMVWSNKLCHGRCNMCHVL